MSTRSGKGSRNGVPVEHVWRHGPMQRKRQQPTAAELAATRHRMRRALRIAGTRRALRNAS